jgi:hypothetical protein
MDDPRITRAISICKKVVSGFSCSWKRRRGLGEAQQQLGLPSHQLITVSATRWGSRLGKIERVLKQERGLSKVPSADKKSRPLVFIWQDVDIMESVKKALKPLQDITDALSEYVTLSYVRPVLHLLNTSLVAPEEEEMELCKSIKAHILEYLNSKYSERKTSDLLDIASLLDPRFRASYIAKEKLEGLKCTAVQEVEASLRDQGAAAEPQLDEPPAKKRKTLSSFFKKSTASCTTTVTTREAVENELSSYLMAACIDSEANPLQWWKDHEVAFPALSCLAKKYLCVPATSSPSERVFSCSGNIVTCHRASLNPDTVDRLVFLARNLE